MVQGGWGDACHRLSVPCCLPACHFALAGIEVRAESNAYLGYLAERVYSPRTIRACGYGLLAFSRWLCTVGLTIERVSTDDVLGFLSAQESVRGRPGQNVLDLNGNRSDRLAPASINLRLAAVTGLYEYRAMRDPAAESPIPKGRASSWFAAGERSGILAHTKATARGPLQVAGADPALAAPGTVAARGHRPAGQPAHPGGTWRWPG